MSIPGARPAPSGRPRSRRVAGNPTDLLLVLWNRLAIDETNLAITGDPAVAASFRPPA